MQVRVIADQKIEGKLMSGRVGGWCVIGKQTLKNEALGSTSTSHLGEPKIIVDLLGQTMCTCILGFRNNSKNIYITTEHDHR